jgi:polygalacturonase
MDTTSSLSASLTVTDNIHLNYLAGCETTTTGYSLTVAGGPSTISAPADMRCFTSTEGVVEVVFSTEGLAPVGWFGAAGDGSTDDTYEIQAAVDAFPSTGGTISFVSGRTYLVSAVSGLNCIEVDEKDNFTIDGNGATILTSDVSFALFVTDVDDFALRNLTFNTPGGYGAFFEGSSTVGESDGIIVENCIFNDAGDGGGLGFEGNNGDTHGPIRNVKVRNCHFEGGVYGLYLRSGNITGGVAGLYDVAVSDCTVYSNTTGISMSADNAEEISAVTFSGLHVRDNISSGIDLVGSQITVTNSTITENPDGITFQEVNGVSITGNVISNNTDDAFSFAGQEQYRIFSHNNAIYGNSGSSNGTQDIYEGTDIVITGNVPVAFYTTDGEVYASLASGVVVGDTKTFTMTAAGNNADLTITNHETSDPEIARFDAVDEYLLLMWTGTEWVTVANTCTFP